MSDPNETTGFDPAMVESVFGSEPETVEVSQEPVTAEKPADSEPTKPEPPANARIAAAKRAEARAAQLRSASVAKEQELARERAALDARAKQVEERDQLLRLMEEDPAKYFEVKKLGAKGIQAHLERLANGLKPEEVQEKRQSALEAELERLKAREAEREEADRAAKHAAEVKAISERQEAMYTAHIEENADAYPNLVEEFPSKESAIKAGYELLNRVVAYDAQGRKITELSAFISQHGKEPTNAQICKFLDDVARERIEARKQNAWRKRTENADSGREPQGTVTRNPTVTGKPRTLSARDTSSRATAPDAKWSQEWADEESLRILRGTA